MEAGADDAPSKAVAEGQVVVDGTVVAVSDLAATVSAPIVARPCRISRDDPALI